jgi:hypothetical protein
MELYDHAFDSLESISIFLIKLLSQSRSDLAPYAIFPKSNGMVQSTPNRSHSPASTKNKRGVQSASGSESRCRGRQVSANLLDQVIQAEVLDSALTRSLIPGGKAGYTGK